MCFFTSCLISCKPGSDNNTPAKIEPPKSKDSPKDNSPPAAPKEITPEGKIQKDKTPSLAVPVETKPAKKDLESKAPSSTTTSAEAQPEITKPLTLLPPNESWTLSIKEIINAGFLKEGGSDLFHYYIEHWFNNIEYIMGILQQTKNSQHKAIWNQLCHDSDCSKGLDLNRIDKSKMQAIITLLSHMPMLSLSDEKDPNRESIFFLQGFLAPPNSNIQYFNHQNIDYQNPKKNPEHIQKMLQLVQHMKQKNTKRIAVNLPLQTHVDPRPFFLLGNLIKQNQMDLHIVGGCEFYCARYLIPAAKTVYLEPYGHIYFNGSFSAWAEEFAEILAVLMEEYREHVKKEGPSQLEDKVTFINSGIQNSINSDNYSDFIEQFKKGIAEKAVAFEKSLDDFYYNLPSKNHLVNFTEKERKQFLRSLSQELLDELMVFISLNSNPKIQASSNYVLGTLFYLKTLESAYYAEIDIEELPSSQNYTFFDLLQLAALLVKVPEYERFFPVPRFYYNVPEKDKPYYMVTLSVGLLKSLGIDIRGKNNLEMIGSDKNSKKTFLYLDTKRIANCKFFEKGASFTTETLYGCLFENMDQ